MTYALIDNASLTAVQRVLGEIQIKDTETMNGDLVALENLIQGILFYDDLVCVDNYKVEFREARKRRFPFVRFLDEKEFDFRPIEIVATRESNLIRPEIRGGHFADADFGELIKLLKMNMICTWDMTSSVYYLTMKMLGQPNSEEYRKYAALSASIFSELSEIGQTQGHWSKAVRIVSSTGHVFTTEEMSSARNSKVGGGHAGTTRALDMFIASLTWLAYKTIYYSLVSKYLRADTLLHPIRHAFQISWMKKSGTFGADFTSKLVKSLSSEINKTVVDVVDAGRSVALATELPHFSAYIASKNGGVDGILETALSLRGTADVSAIRGALKEIRVAYDDGDFGKTNKKVEKWTKELNKASASARTEYGLKTSQGIPSSWLVAVINAATSHASIPKIPDPKFTIPIPDFIKTERSKAFACLLKDMTRELTTVEKLGTIRDLLSKGFVLEPDARPGQFAPKTEDPKFQHVTSHWKLPM